MKKTLSDQELLRYSRHLSLPHFGHKAQNALKMAKVLVVGAGGLGAPVLQYLCAAGVGTIGVVDFDRVDITNLQRQILFSEGDIGQAKAETAIKKLRSQNSHIEFTEHAFQLNRNNAIELISDYDLVIDGTDNFPTRYLINDACVLTNRPFIYGSIYQFEGQVSVFNYQDGPNYRDLFPTPPPPGMVPNCAEGGVLGVLPGIIGSIQALEAIKVLTHVGEALSGRLFVFDALSFSNRTIQIEKDPTNPISGPNPTITQLQDYEWFCNGQFSPDIPSISVEQLQKWITENRAFKLIDVRERAEFDAGHLEAEHLPLSEFAQWQYEVPSNETLVFYCKSGKRSVDVIQQLKEHPNASNFFNLEGGILAWKQKIEPKLCVI